MSTRALLRFTLQAARTRTGAVVQVWFRLCSAWFVEAQFWLPQHTVFSCSSIASGPRANDAKLPTCTSFNGPGMGGVKRLTPGRETDGSDPGYARVPPYDGEVNRLFLYSFFLRITILIQYIVALHLDVIVKRTFTEYVEKFGFQCLRWGIQVGLVEQSPRSQANVESFKIAHSFGWRTYNDEKRASLYSLNLSFYRLPLHFLSFTSHSLFIILGPPLKSGVALIFFFKLVYVTH